jgi:hypothetical protein
MKGLLYFVIAAVVGTTLCDLISSGGFYWFSGRFDDVNVAEFAGRIAKYLPLFMKTTLMYLGIAAVVHLVVLQAGKLGGKESHT